MYSKDEQNIESNQGAQKFPFTGNFDITMYMWLRKSPGHEVSSGDLSNQSMIKRVSRGNNIIGSALFTSAHITNVSDKTKYNQEFPWSQQVWSQR